MRMVVAHFVQKLIISLSLLFIPLYIFSNNSEKRSVTIGIDWAYPPFEFINNEGKPDGFNVELVEALMKELGWEYRFKAMNWSDVMQALERKEIDIVAGMAISAERKKHFLFSIPHSFLFQNMVCHKDSAFLLVSDLKSKKVAFQRDDIATSFIDTLGLEKNVVLVNDLYAGMQQLSEGKVDALICGDLLAKYIIKEKSLSDLGIRYLNVIDPIPYGIAISKNYPELKSEINIGLDRLKKIGVYNELYEKWFGHRDDDRILREVYIVVGVLLLIVLLCAIVIVISRRHIRKVTGKLHEANEQLKEKNIYLEMVLKSGDIMPIIIDYNKQYLDISPLGNANKYLPCDDFTNFNIEDWMTSVRDEDKEKIKTVFAQIKTGKEQAIQLEICTKEDQYFILNFKGADYDELHIPQKLIGYFQCITKRKQIENKLNRHNEFMNSVLDKLPVPVHIKDFEQQKYIYWNKESERLFGGGLFKFTSDILNKKSSEDIRLAEKKVYESGIPYDNQEYVVLNDGRTYDTIVNKSLIYDGSKKYILIVRWDVTEKKELYKKMKILSLSTQALNAYTWFFDLDANKIIYGEGFEQLGIPYEEVNSLQRFAQKIHPRDRKRFLDYMTGLGSYEKEELFIDYEIDFSGRGEYQWWECRGRVEQEDRNGAIYKYVYGMCININIHKRNEEVLLENKQNLKALIQQNELILNNINTGLLYLDLDYKILWENISVYKPDESILSIYRQGKICYRERLGLDVPCPKCIVHKSRETLQTESKELIYNNRTFELMSIPLLDENKELLGSILRITDITEKEEINRELKIAKDRAEEANRLLNNIFDMLPCILFVRDITDGNKFIKVNHVFCSTIQKEQHEIIGKTDYEVFANNEVVKLHREFEETMEPNKAYVYDESIEFKGKLMTWQTTKLIIDSVDGHKIILGISLDLTDKMEAFQELKIAKEKAEQSNKLKSAFLANMSHEIRTPLNAIVGFSNLIASVTDDEDKEMYCQLINSNNDLLLRLIGDILDLSRIEAGMLELNPEEFDIVAVLYNLYYVMKQNVTSPDVELLCEIPDSEYFVKLDKDRFSQVISNFMTNAIKFTRKGHIKMGYKLENGGIKVYVSDTGIGISPDKKAKVFERFEKLNTFAQGTGLGMAICKAITDASGGSIGVESEENHGSTFWAWFPLSQK